MLLLHIYDPLLCDTLCSQLRAVICCFHHNELLKRLVLQNLLPATQALYTMNNFFLVQTRGNMTNVGRHNSRAKMRNLMQFKTYFGEPHAYLTVDVPVISRFIEKSACFSLFRRKQLCKTQNCYHYRDVGLKATAQGNNRRQEMKFK